MCLTTFYLFFLLFTFSLMLFHPKLLWVHDREWGVGGGGGGGVVFICATQWQGVGMRVGMGGGCSSGPKSDVQWAKKWGTVGQNVTYAGLKSDVWAKMQDWSVIMLILAWLLLRNISYIVNSPWITNTLHSILIFSAFKTVYETKSDGQYTV